MNAKVFGQRGTVGKLLVAELARIRLLTAVRAHVGGHTGALRESPVTDRTAEGFLSRMSSRVGSQVGGL